MMTAFSADIGVVHGLATRLIDTLAPKLVVVCTDLEIHPLTAHAIYHRNPQGFVEDLSWIRTLHVDGGFYGQNTTRGDALYQRPRSISRDYGYLRARERTTESTVDWIESLIEGRWSEPLQIDEAAVITECGNAATVMPTRNGLYVANDDGAAGYLEEPFAQLALRVTG